MNITKMSPDEIRIAGMKALVRDLGPAGPVVKERNYDCLIQA